MDVAKHSRKECYSNMVARIKDKLLKTAVFSSTKVFLMFKLHRRYLFFYF